MKEYFRRAGLTIALAASTAGVLAVAAWGLAYAMERYALTAEAQRASAEVLAVLPPVLLYLGLAGLLLAGAAALIRFTWSLSYVAETWVDVRKVERVRLAGRGSLVAARLRAAGLPVLDTGSIIIDNVSRAAVDAQNNAPASRPTGANGSPRKRAAADAGAARPDRAS